MSKLTVNSIPIAMPPWPRLGKHIESAVRKALFEYDLIEGANHIALALSGGKDSLTLLYMLNAIRGRGISNFKLTAIHISGAYSCGPSIADHLLRPICKQLDIEFVVIETKQDIATLECYSCSRRRRQLIFHEAKRRGISHIAFGHHEDDVNQTLLLNLLHKGEFAAMLAKVPMQAYGITIIRPLVYVKEKAIVEFANLYGFARISCQCPVGQNSKRKQVASLLKQMEKLFPNTHKNLAHAAKLYGSKKALLK